MASYTHLIDIQPQNGGQDAEQFAEQLANSIVKYLTRTNNPHIMHTKTRGQSHISYTRTDPVISTLCGIHRVQRQPPNGSGKRHTSTATVTQQSTHTPTAFLDRKDVTIQWYQGQGAGGQHRNRSSNAVRIVHTPTGITATRDGRSRTANLKQAYKQLEQRINTELDIRHTQTVSHERQQQKGTVAAWTWNWQRGTVTLHHPKRTVQLKAALNGRW